MRRMPWCAPGGSLPPADRPGPRGAPVTAWLLRRLAASVAIVFAVLTFTFVLIHLAPGTPFLPSSDDRSVNPEAIARLKRVYGLDRPLAVQYVKYLGNVARGELGGPFS